jgi:hypothetical protein
LTGKQAVSISSEVLECFGGAGYVEDTGLPRLLRDAQVLPIWEGTTNVLSLDVLRAIAKEGALDELVLEIEGLVAGASEPLSTAGRAAVDCARGARAWLQSKYASDPRSVESSARRFAMTLGRAMEVALLVRHAKWAEVHEGDRRPRFAALRLARHGIDLLCEHDGAESTALANDEA